MKITVQPKNELTFDKLKIGQLFIKSVDSHRLVHMKIVKVHLLNRDREMVNCVSLSDGQLSHYPDACTVIEVREAELAVEL